MSNPIRLGITETGVIVPVSQRTHAENVWDVRHDFGAGYVAIGQGVPAGNAMGRKNALNLAVWLLRAIGATRPEVDQAMFEATSAPMAQGFRAQFGQDE
jgi:hypothetical protein